MRRVAEAKALLDAGEWSGAYHTIGYAPELGFKACIAKLSRPDTFPDRAFAVRVFTHKIGVLVEAAGLLSTLEADLKSSTALNQNWIVALRWDEQSRYAEWPEAKARELFEAITDPSHGVLPWITPRW